MRAYEDLSGGQGRQIFYRAERFHARDVFGPSRPSLELAGQDHELRDFSMTGLSALGAVPPVSGQGTAPVPIRLQLDGAVLYEGIARVLRQENGPFGNTVAVQFEDGYLDVRRVLTRHHAALLRREIARTEAHELALVPPEYRQLCSETLFRLRQYRTVADRFERRIAEEFGGVVDGEMQDFIQECEERIIADWRSVWARADAMVRPLRDQPQALAAVKHFTENVLTPELMGGAIWKRSYEKPLGYPGDFQIMNYVYNWAKLGNTIYDRLLHRIGLDVAECIATRMVMVQRAIAEVAAAHPDRETRITSLGSGPACEVINTLKLPRLPGRITFTLVDQDHQALTHAYETAHPEIVRSGGRASVQCLHTTFSRLLKAGELFGSLAPQHLIYTVGLIDYLTERRARTFVTSLYEQLAPGGLLIVGNMKDTPMSNFWPMEVLTDWSIIYRTEAEMRDLTIEIPAAASIEIVDDRTGRVTMAYIRKPS
jgi:hypothetical protein